MTSTIPPRPRDAELCAALDRINQHPLNTSTLEAVQEALHHLPPHQWKPLIKALHPSQRVTLLLEMGQTGAAQATGPLLASLVEILPREELPRFLGSLRGTPFNRLLDAVRTGDVKDQDVVLSIAVESVARTSWGADHPVQVERLRTLHAHGCICIAEFEARAHSAPEPGVIRVHSKLLRSPEALAAFLAHQAMHHVAEGQTGLRGTLTEDTAGTIASARVWAEIGRSEDAYLPERIRDSLNDFAEAFRRGGASNVRACAATKDVKVSREWYEWIRAKAATVTDPLERTRREKQAHEHAYRIRVMVQEMAQDPEAQRHVTEETTWELFKATSTLGFATEDAQRLGRAVKHAPHEAREAIMKEMAQHPDALVAFCKGAGMDSSIRGSAA